jgi:hypothetical protein
MFMAANKNKRGLTLDYRTEEGRQALMTILAQADIVFVDAEVSLALAPWAPSPLHRRRHMALRPRVPQSKEFGPDGEERKIKDLPMRSGENQGETDRGAGGSLDPGLFLTHLGHFLRTSVPFIWCFLSAFLPT